MVRFSHISSFSQVFRYSIAAAVASLSILCGFVPTTIGKSSVMDFDASAWAQSITLGEAEQYAKTVLEMEPYRQEFYAKVKEILGSADVPDIVCTKRSSLQRLPQKARPIAVEYCNRYKKTAQRNNLSDTQFNNITMWAQSNPDIKTLIQNQMLLLQTAPRKR